MIPRQFNYDPDFRKRQIDTLKIFNDNVQVIKENEEYSTTFTSGGRQISITVLLGPNFPNERPRIVATPPVQHHWCNANGEIDKAPGLLNYTPHSDLGRIVQAITREFEKFPPPFISENPQSSPERDASNVENTKSPTISSASECNIPELSKLSLDELKKLDSDPEFFDDFIEELSVVQTLNNELDTMISEVERISKENESKECHLSDMKTKLKNDFHTLKSLGEKYEKLNSQYMKKSQEFAPQHIRELLQIAVSNSDSDCEKHVESFLSGKIDVQTFLNQYTESKKISAMRKAKEERLAHQLNALERAAL